MTSIQPRKQRRAFHNAPLHKKRKWLASHLSENLLLKYDKRSLPIIKGDTAKVMRGSYKGHEDKIVSVNSKKGILQIEGLTMVKADGKKIARPIHPSNVMITKLNLTDKWRRRKIERGLSEETKKEIEQEAEQQIKEQEAEEKRRELEAQKEAEALEEESTLPPKDIAELEKPAEKPAPPPPKEEPEKPVKKTVPKPATKKAGPTKKAPAKKSPSKKPATKKTATAKKKPTSAQKKEDTK